ncbi:hypothetical protein SGFS_071490 [Streptomyces graminofaciens]|uniref:Uncharacterized protein n=1 Tax=Streptomyces graminofaciens TaxID=68212 RepID=A0ABN5VTH5_9ACTN|nr:hypothetical protein [Streptomyces graminofaciens]BBC35855.1 hypothetical protein SGFS_071490 [Streptomyces graminofaciens]
MAHRDPPGHLAPHIPADDWNRATATGTPVVIVVHPATHTGIPWRRVLVPLAVAGAAGLGGWGLVVAVCALLDATAHAVTVIATAAGPIGVGGITLRLTRTKH